MDDTRLESIKHDQGSEDFAAMQAIIQKSMAQLHVKRKRTWLVRRTSARVSVSNWPAST